MTRYSRIVPQNAEILIYEKLSNVKVLRQWFNILEQEVPWKQDSVKMYGKLIAQPRLTAWYGDSGKVYTYSGLYLEPLEWHPVVLSIKDRIESITGESFNSCLLNLYRNGSDSMGWHQDNEKELGKNPTIASFSLGGQRQFHLKHISEPHIETLKLPLSDGSLIVMKGETQHFWKHHVPKTKRIVLPRINLTFRTII